MRAEIELLNFAAQTAQGYTPKIIFTDLENRCIVIEYINGKNFTEGKAPPRKSIEAAVKFFKLLNSDHSAAKVAITQDAAEGFLTLREHIENVRARIEKMEVKHLEENLQERAKNYLWNIHKKLENVEETTYERIKNAEVNDAIGIGERMVSPSDFGFHNAIRTKTGVCFIDFEFAGWDDPAKTFADFVLQPKVPAAKETMKLFLKSIQTQQKIEIERRLETLTPILELKWLCIVLGFLDPERMQEIKKQMPEEEVKFLFNKRLEMATNSGLTYTN